MEKLISHVTLHFGTQQIHEYMNGDTVFDHQGIRSMATRAVEGIYFC